MIIVSDAGCQVHPLQSIDRIQKDGYFLEAPFVMMYCLLFHSQFCLVSTQEGIQKITLGGISFFYSFIQLF